MTAVLKLAIAAALCALAVLGQQCGVGEVICTGSCFDRTCAGNTERIQNGRCKCRFGWFRVLSTRQCVSSCNGQVTNSNQINTNTPQQTPNFGNTNIPNNNNNNFGFNRIPGTNFPGINTPNINVPGVNQPFYPNINNPNINVPGVNVPGVNQPFYPGVNTPNVNVPGFNSNLPNVNVPGFNSNLPNVNFPNTGNIPYTGNINSNINPFPSIPSINTNLPNTGTNLPNIPYNPNIPNLLTTNQRITIPSASPNQGGLVSIPYNPNLQAVTSAQTAGQLLNGFPNPGVGVINQQTRGGYGLIPSQQIPLIMPNQQITQAQYETIIANLGTDSRVISLYNPEKRNHLLTRNPTEVNSAVRNGYQYEGSVGRLVSGPDPVQCPLYRPLKRWYKLFEDDHFYTISTQHDGQLTGLGYTNEGDIGKCVAGQQCGATLPLHRYFNNALKDHYYTTNQTIFQDLNTKYLTCIAAGTDCYSQNCYCYEGIECYVYSSQE